MPFRYSELPLSAMCQIADIELAHPNVGSGRQEDRNFARLNACYWLAHVSGFKVATDVQALHAAAGGEVNYTPCDIPADEIQRISIWW